MVFFLSAGLADAKPLKPGDFFRDCPECPELAVVPAGEFDMGSTKGKPRELPIRKLRVARPFAIGRYEVTFAEWDACNADGGCAQRPFDRGWGRGRRPVINVVYAEILDYMKWISAKTGETYRLPSEAEWEYATRAGSKTEYWWGDDVGKGRANCRRCGTEWSGVKSAPVGSFEKSPWGLYDVHGNVLEMVADCWFESHSRAPADLSTRDEPDCANRVVKGGAWYYLPKVSRSASRARNHAKVFSYFIGFRVLREIKPEAKPAAKRRERVPRRRNSGRSRRRN